MTLIDFIELSDDNIIDLSSDEETVHEDQIATQHRAMLLDKQGVFFLAGEGSQGVQAVFVAAGEGSQDEQAVFVAANEGSQDRQAVFVAASEGRQEASEPGHALEATASSMIMEEAPLVAASQGSQDVQVVSVAASEGRQETAESVHALEATAVSLVTEKPPVDTVVLALPHAGSLNCLGSPTSGPFASLTSTAPKALTFEGGDTKLVRAKVKRPRKNHHTGTPKAVTSEGGDAKPVRLKTKHPKKKNHTEKPPLGTAVLALPHAESPNCPHTSAPFPSLTCTSPKALSSEGGDANLMSGKVKHRTKNYGPCKLTP
ncbi:uncharacterized protein LOC119266726 isoform X2 [Triticum dicoccoides]|uniref:uncharacterized protein LOC119266726 isoform X2 n=1 Tax=Triticum dicoccoides TaxID=85692 RepID=UPI0018900B2F|nr:uncharacterized protein LOC119266726 isoform X2 [Triticum dicoccoides]